ncbi:MAG: phosphate ABC transporter substrate-binding protein PstS, partial [Pseudomonadota bacterium]|nr:phosphate ABC transporter substrate-binding protein PstS [Pseudomonadota bacterium]
MNKDCARLEHLKICAGSWTRHFASTLNAWALGVLAATVLAATSMASDVTGAGSTFVYPILSKWSADYSVKTGDHLNYQSIGSGGGIAQIKAGTVDFGATDKPLEAAELSQAGLGQFPLVIGGVIPVVNIAGIQAGTIKFSGPLLADIYLGKIKKWSDPAIRALNAGLALPDADISVVHRSDGSGTTFNWVNYLSKVSPEWKSTVGEGTSVSWPVGVGGKGNEGVAEYVRRIPNAIGYVEYAYVLQNKMVYGLLQNRAGKFVTPNNDSFQAAAATEDWAGSKDFFLVMTDAPGPNAYPLTATTFILMYK